MVVVVVIEREMRSFILIATRARSGTSGIAQKVCKQHLQRLRHDFCDSELFQWSPQIPDR